MNASPKRFINNDFAIRIQFKPDSRNPARIFRSMTRLIDTFQKLDRALVQSIDSNIVPILLLEDVEAGSLKSWFRSVLESADDSALNSGDWKKVIGNYRVRAKHVIIDKLRDRSTITNIADVEEIEFELLKAAEETDLKAIPNYRAVSPAQILGTIQDLGNALANWGC